MKFIEFLRSLGREREARKADAALASMMHDTGFDEKMRSLAKAVRSVPQDPNENVTSARPVELSKAIESLYVAFGWRRLSDPFDYCSCCISKSDAKHFKTAPLRSLNGDDLFTVSTNVPYTVGKLDDILYFTPRILEHAATESCYLDVSQVFNHLQSEPPKLKEEESVALGGFFRLIWTALKEHDQSPSLVIRDVVLATAVLTGEIGTYLHIWRRSPAIYRYIASMNDDGFGDPFWGLNTPSYRSAVAWFQTNQSELEGDFELMASQIAEKDPHLVKIIRKRFANPPWSTK